jgi:hypothetical protein
MYNLLSSYTYVTESILTIWIMTVPVYIMVTPQALIVGPFPQIIIRPP